MTGSGITQAFGTVQSVEARPLGSSLVADVAAGATALTVDHAADFDEGGGLLLLNGSMMAYDSADVEMGVLTLAVPFVGSASQDDPVVAVEAGGPAVEWVANVSTDDGDTIEATIPTSLIGYFDEGVYTEPTAVELHLVDGAYEVVTQPQQAASLDGAAVWNPHALADIATASAPDATYTSITNWIARDVDGMGAVGAQHTIQYPGIYAISMQVAFTSNTNGRRRARVLVNGDTSNPVLFRSVAPDPGVVDYVGFARDVRLAENDVVTVEVWQDSGAPLTFGASAGSSNFSIHRVSV